MLRTVISWREPAEQVMVRLSLVSSSCCFWSSLTAAATFEAIVFFVSIIYLYLRRGDETLDGEVSNYIQDRVDDTVWAGDHL
jgi:hypothetical protein